jgi:ion channel-forming bestrophin family protein
VIVKRNLSPQKVAGYIWRPIALTALVSLGALVLRRVTGSDSWQLPFAPIGTLGAAVAIFVAFRNNASYARWWEARTLWANIQNSSRILARQIVAATDNALVSGTGGTEDEVLAYRDEQVLRVVAFAHAVRLTLRSEDGWEDVTRCLPAAERDGIVGATNRPNLVLQRLGIRLKDGVRAQIVGQFDPITLEPNLAALNASFAAAERIKETPTPRQYDYFTRVAVLLFAVLLPFGLLSLLPEAQDAWVPLLAVVIAGVFVVLERVGSIVDAPFANTTTDVPMTAICRAIERDLLEQLGHTPLPPPVAAVDGYLW